MKLESARLGLERPETVRLEPAHVERSRSNPARPESTHPKPLFVTKRQLEELVSQYSTPFHLYDEAGIRRTAEDLLAAFSWNEGFREYFAVKANPNPAIMQVLAEYGCGFDCATRPELMLAEAVGAQGHDIMFSSNDTPAADFRHAARLEALVNFDALDMVDFYERSVGRLPEVVCLRVNPGGDFEGTNGIFDTPETSKFGMTPTQLTEACRALVARGVRAIGLHALLASNTHGNGYYPALAHLLFTEAVRLHRETGVHVAFVNLSGGVGIPYAPDDEPCDIRAIGEAVRKAFENVLVPAGMGGVALFTELGRFMTGPHGCIVTRALHLKRTYHDYVGVDACAADLMRPAMYDAYHHVTVVGHPGGADKTLEPPTHVYDVVGGLCENNDRFANARALPEVEAGDLLVIHDTGAHGRSMGYNYNGRLRSAEVLLHPDGSSDLIRRAETAADYFATLDASPFGERLERIALEQAVVGGEP
ncbi:MAG: diaminopimelate decarboxylase [Atopobiaceae bacterium]|nr:diaminopimelate decarboxylase [Atopobiaceae bacterium]